MLVLLNLSFFILFILVTISLLFFGLYLLNLKKRKYNNEIEKKKDGLARKERQAYHKLNKAIESNNEKDIQTCLKAYIDAADDNQRDLEEDYEQLCKVLPEKKVAKLMVAEEKFRHQQIGRLRHHRGNNNARKGNQK